MRIIILAAALAAPTLAHAESQIERMERLSVALQGKLYAMMEAEVPAVKGNLPDPAWNDAVRAAATCTLTSYQDALGEDGVDAMFTQMEEVLASPATNFDTMLNGMDVSTGLSDAENAAIEQKCQMGQATMSMMMADPKFQNFVAAMGQMMDG